VRRRAARGANTRQETAIVNGPSAQSVAMAAASAYVSNTASPMTRGSRVWAGDPGFGVHRFAGEAPPPTGDPSARAIAPVAVPQDTRYGFQGGPSSPPAYPSTGDQANFGAVAALDLGKLGRLGWGS